MYCFPNCDFWRFIQANIVASFMTLMITIWDQISCVLRGPAVWTLCSCWSHENSINLPYSKLHTVRAYHVVDFFYHWFWRICYYETYRNLTVDILFRTFLHFAVYCRHYNFSTSDCPVNIGSCCHCHAAFSQCAPAACPATNTCAI